MVAFKAALFICALALPVYAQNAPAAEPQRPDINWGKCPQLQPSKEERQQKALAIDTCLEKVPLPDVEHANETVIQQHREDVTTCALHSEGWFNKNGQYRFDRARTEILNKKLAAEVEPQVLAKHDECKKEAEEKFAHQFVAQVQLYQACMDYHISQICGIQIQAGAPAGGVPQQPPQQG
uniref:Immunogenic protein n=1 Tax=Haemaphysalis longicornis TaxID=44386 RepID=G3BJU6_HAELO|nr:immunogenic protein [Haemaphysalis longicornis]